MNQFQREKMNSLKKRVERCFSAKTSKDEKQTIFGCDECDDPFEFTADELAIHRAVYHKKQLPSVRRNQNWDEDSYVAPAVPKRKKSNAKIKAERRGRNSGTGNDSESSPGPSASQHGSNASTVLQEVSKMIKTSIRQEEKRFELTARYQERMARLQAKNSFRPAEYCDVFKPDDIDKEKLLNAFAQWLLDFKQLESVMESLEMTEIEKYNVLKNRVG